MQGVLKTDFENYVNANDAVLRNIQNQGQGLQNQMTNLMEILSKFVNSNTASTSSSWRNDEKRRENANEQIEKFYEIFKDMSFEISFMDALTLMPKFASTLKALIENKEKLSEMARTPLNEHCSAVILNKLPEKLGDPGRFLIPSNYNDMTANRIDIVGYLACESILRSLGFSIMIAGLSGNPTPGLRPNSFISSSTLTLFRISDFLLLEEPLLFLALATIQLPPEVENHIMTRVGTFLFSMHPYSDPSPPRTKEIICRKIEWNYKFGKL
ncbi:hypothetical protein Tco_0168965 [Tanacetum coccineum]